MKLLLSSPFKSPEFQKLFQHWNKVLEEDGFKDAEDFSLPEAPLKSWHSKKWVSGEAHMSESTNYYDMASELLHNGFSFKNDLYRRVWELHCQGMSVRKIEHVLSYQLIGYIGRTKSNVNDVIINIQKQSGLKNGR
jgi:hypothetical protein